MCPHKQKQMACGSSVIVNSIHKLNTDFQIPKPEISSVLQSAVSLSPTFN